MLKRHPMMEFGIEFPRGSGGHFLSLVLYCCLNDINWPDNLSQKHFHNAVLSTNILCKHKINLPDESVLCIDSQSARYNFWIYYYWKNICNSLPYYYANGYRWPEWNSEQRSYVQDGYSLIDQCSYIISYQPRTRYRLDWIDMIYSPTAWYLLDEFLSEKKFKNHWNYDKWFKAVTSYKSTLLLKNHINFSHQYWYVWAFAVLQHLEIHVPFRLIDIRGNDDHKAWLSSQTEILLNYTKKTYYPLD